MRALRFKGTGRRAEIAFLAALIVFVGSLSLRGLRDRTPVSLAVDPNSPAPAPVERGTQQMIGGLQDRIRRNPNDTSAYAQLGLALLQRVRETGDPSLYNQAETALSEALKREPQQVDALVGQASLALSRHHFADALQLGERLKQINPYRAQIYGIVGDAQTELGQYDAAVTTVQKMVDTRPELSSYSRVSYVRELHGDLPGAIEAMEQALQAGNPQAEQTLWTQVQLGNLYFNSGDLIKAEATYQQALKINPDYVYAYAGVARVRAAQGHPKEAIDGYKRIVEVLPLPEFVIALGELYETTGQAAKAQQQYDLVRAMQQLQANAGVDVDLELALFDADHGADPGKAVERARAAYSRRPSIYAADALAWALYHHGDYAAAHRYSDESLRLGTKDAMLHYHAGMIAQVLGDKVAAHQHLQQALTINPYFSIHHAPAAQKALKQ